MAFLAVLLPVVSAAMHMNLLYVHVVELENKIPVDGYIRRLSTRSRLECGQTCTTMTDCDSFFYVQKFGLCQQHTGLLYPTYPGKLRGARCRYYVPEGLATTSTVTSTTTGITTTTTPIMSTTTAVTTTTTAITSTTTPITTTTTPITSTTTPITSTTTAVTTPTLSTTPVSIQCLSNSGSWKAVQLTSTPVFYVRYTGSSSMNYTDAVQLCDANDARLPNVITSAKLNYYRTMFYQCVNCRNRDFWIDGQYDTTTSKWVTSSGYELTRAWNRFWYPGQPDSPLTDHCLWLPQNKDYFIDDASCSSLANVLCEK